MIRPYCRFNHGKMLKTRGKFSKRDGCERQYYHCRNGSCSYTALEQRDDDAYFRERHPDTWAKAQEHLRSMFDDARKEQAMAE